MNELEFIRGDTDQISIEFLREGKPYKPHDIEDGDIFTLTVRDRYSENVVLQKRTLYPNLLIQIEHEDTKNLGVAEYRFDIEYSKPDKSVVKTLMRGSCKILKDETF